MLVAHMKMNNLSETLQLNVSVFAGNRRIAEALPVCVSS